MEKWTKKLGDMHYAWTDEKGFRKTLCGRPCLGNNYSEQFSDRKICPECQMKNDHRI